MENFSGRHLLSMIECIGAILLSNEYWDCECEESYIQPRGVVKCNRCDSERESQPDSRLFEVIRAGFPVLEEEVFVLKYGA